MPIVERERPVRPEGVPLVERLQVREKIGGRLPLFIIKDNEKTREFFEARRAPGALVAISSEGDTFYATFHERLFVKKPDLYKSWSKLPPGWTLARMLDSIRIRPISEVVIHKVRKEGGSVEAAIRSTDHILEKYQEKGRELHQLDVVEAQIERALGVLQETESVPKEEFIQGFEILFRQTLELMEQSGLTRARLSLKKDIERLLQEASMGKDILGRRNPMAMLKKLEAAARRVSYRRSETDYIITKFRPIRATLTSLRDKDRGILADVGNRLDTQIFAHAVFRQPEKGTTSLQGQILMAKIGRLIYQLERTTVKPYRAVASEMIKELQEGMKAIGRRDYGEAKSKLEQVSGRIDRVLDQ